MRIRPLEDNDCKAVTRLHNQYIPQGTLNLLGDAFTALIYKAMVNSNNAFCIVAEEDGAIAGFVAGAVNVKDFYKEFLKKFPFRPYLIAGFKCLNMQTLQKVWRLFKYPNQFASLPEAEFLSLVVTPEYRKKGLMFSLLNKVISGFKEKGIRQIRLSMHSSLLDNQRFYERFGAALSDEVKFSENDRLLLYSWDISQFSLSFDPFAEA